MLLTIAIILGILWLLGIVAIHITSPLLHLVLLIAIVVFIYHLVTGRNRV